MRAAVALRQESRGDDAVATGRDRAVLDRIMQPHVHLAIWRRGCTAPLPILDWDAIDDIDADIAVDRLASDVPAVLAAAGYPVMTPAIAAFATDLVALAANFASLLTCDDVRVRLDVIDTDACRKFHADQVTVRLLMPLVGPGTQWMRAGTESLGPDGQLEVGDVGLFKGRVWAEEPVILHRSPPIAETGITRLLLVIDPLDAAMVSL